MCYLLHSLQELQSRTEVVPVSLINRNVGIQLSAEKVASLLTRMCLRSVVCEGGKSVSIEVPPTRAGKPFSDRTYFRNLILR